jgi:hypothetical protein
MHGIIHEIIAKDDKQERIFPLIKSQKHREKSFRFRKCSLFSPHLLLISVIIKEQIELRRSDAFQLE